MKNVSITRLKQPIGLFTVVVYVPFMPVCEVTRVVKWE